MVILQEFGVFKQVSPLLKTRSGTVAERGSRKYGRLARRFEVSNGFSLPPSWCPNRSLRRLSSGHFFLYHFSFFLLLELRLILTRQSKFMIRNPNFVILICKIFVFLDRNCFEFQTFQDLFLWSSQRSCISNGYVFTFFC